MTLTFRMKLSRSLIQLGKFVQSLPAAVMKPDEIIAFSRNSYASPESVKEWTSEEVLAKGLSPEEKALLEKSGVMGGELLLLGVGGGREAVPLAEAGFKVTGVDFVSELVEKAVEYVRSRGFEMRGLVQEVSELDISLGSFDVVWQMAGMYSSLPTRKRRLRMLRKVFGVLKPGGCFLCQFRWDVRAGISRRAELMRKLTACLTLGNIGYEKGDVLWGNIEFLHAFASVDEIESEFKQGGFDVVHLHIPGEGKHKGGAVLRKPVS